MSDRPASSGGSPTPSGAEAFDPATVPVRPAATVMLVRDAADGLEVFMLRRTSQAIFAGGMYVFPGGAVDDADRTDDAAGFCDGRTNADASHLLQVETGGLAWWIAAIRECFEEAGFLLATHNGATVRLDDPRHTGRYEIARRAVHSGALTLRDLCAEEDLRLDLSDVHYIANWITPPGQQRRFDTRFFVARAPEDQTPLHDGAETVESLWIRPADALDRFAAGEFGMFPPTVAVLAWLAASDTTDQAMEAGAAVGIPPTIRPEDQFDGSGELLKVEWRGRLI